MGKPQSSFLIAFEAAFKARSGRNLAWSGGQSAAKTAALPIDASLRREGQAKDGERFELADLAANIGRWRVIIEFESREVPLSNLLKFWPYIRGELDVKPDCDVLICHFSDWWSYATRRDLWRWTLERMKDDPARMVKSDGNRVEIDGKQFDHWGDNEARRAKSMADAIDWILKKTDDSGS